MAWDIGAFEYVSAGITVSVTQAVTAADASPTVTLTTVLIHPSVTDAVTAADTATVTLTTVAIYATVTDAVTATDTATVTIGLPVVKTESVTVGETATLRLKAWYQPNALTVNTGSVLGGDVESAWADDGDILQLEEVTGTPAFSYDFSYTDVPDDRAESVVFIGQYDGNAAHQVWVRQYNFDSTNWEDLVRIPSSASEGTVTHALVSGTGSYWESGEIRLRIIHTSAGSPIHVLYIDAFVLTSLPAVHVDEAVTVGESATVTLATVRYTVSVTDAVTVGESVTVTLSTVTGLAPSVSDAVSVGEAVTAALATARFKVDVSDALTCAESVTVTLTTARFTLSVSESVTVGESATATLLTVHIHLDVTDGITVGESVKVVVDPVAIHATDAVTVGESASASTGLTGLTITVTDAVTVGERRYVTVYNYPIVLAVDETLTVAQPFNQDFHSAKPVDATFTVAEPFNQGFVGEHD